MQRDNEVAIFAAVYLDVSLGPLGKFSGPDPPALAFWDFFSCFLLRLVFFQWSYGRENLAFFGDVFFLLTVRSFLLRVEFLCSQLCLAYNWNFLSLQLELFCLQSLF